MPDQPDSLPPSRWFTVSQDTIDTFAEVTHDPQFIHTDPVRAAAETPFGGTIAHGFLSLSLLSAMAMDVLPRDGSVAMAVNYGFNRVRFVSPVPSGARVRGVFRVAARDLSTPGQQTTTFDVAVEIEGHDKPALVAEWITRQYVKDSP
ncbi:MAG: MaoC family dehydratase [Pseudomonadota bacterium]